MIDRPLSARWQEFYSRIKDPSWPQIQTENDLLALSPTTLKEILFEHFLVDHGDAVGQPHWFSMNTRPPIDLLPNMDYLQQAADTDADTVWICNDDIKVWYNRLLDGGGRPMGIMFAEILDRICPGRQFDHALEWCSGPGFIGFDLLSRNICRHIYFNDIFAPAIDAIHKTVKTNLEKCQGKVHAHQSASVADLPEHWKFDLVVANPPFFNPDCEQMIAKIFRLDPATHRKAVDDGWKIHEDFFSNIRPRLTSDAVIVMVEATGGSGPGTFTDMVQRNGMCIKDCHWLGYVDGPRAPVLYFLQIEPDAN